jgi:hypothetical protein
MIQKMLPATAFLFALTSIPASAACTQASIEGFWKLYASVASTTGPTWYNCSLNIGAFGGVFRSSCQNAFGQSSPTTGHLSVTSRANCTYSGSINQTATSLTNTITEATLSQDGHTASGVGSFSNGVFTFTMVKVR